MNISAKLSVPFCATLASATTTPGWVVLSFLGVVVVVVVVVVVDDNDAVVVVLCHKKEALWPRMCGILLCVFGLVHGPP